MPFANSCLQANVVLWLEIITANKPAVSVNCFKIVKIFYNKFNNYT